MERHRSALLLAAAALVLGLAGDLLLRWIPWGINAPLWTMLFVAVVLILGRGSPEARTTPFAAVCAILASIGLAWRASPVLRALDVLLMLLFLAMLALRARGVRVASGGLSEMGLALATTGVQTVAGFPQLLFADIAWRQMPSRRNTWRAASSSAARSSAFRVPAFSSFRRRRRTSRWRS